MTRILLNMLTDMIGVVLTIGMWEWFVKDFVTWEGFGTPFRRKNRK